MHLPDGRVIVYVGDDEGQVDVEALAVRVRAARGVDLVGGRLWVARTVKIAIRDAWNRVSWAAEREAREESAKALAVPTARCGQPRADGQPCRRPAGACTDHPGVGPCHHHDDGSVKRERARVLNGQLLAVARLHRKARTEGPLTPAERLEGAVALRAVLLEIQKRRRKSRL